MILGLRPAFRVRSYSLRTFSTVGLLTIRMAGNFLFSLGDDAARSAATSRNCSSNDQQGVSLGFSWGDGAA